MAISSDATVGELVAEVPGRGRVFEQLGIDYCCCGKQSLAAACADRGLALEEVAAHLAVVPQAPTARYEVDPASLTLTALCDHIVQRYHEPLREDLPRLRELAVKVAGVHGENHPELREVRDIFDELWIELENHMETEERVLFPACRALEGTLTPPDMPGGSLARAIAPMEAEHIDTGTALATLRSLTSGFTPPPDACASYRTLQEGLAALEAELHQHIHKENNILFPRAIALDEALRRRG